jgi:hypothetical protein
MIYAIRTEQSNILNGTMVLAGAGTGIRLMPASLHASGVWPDRLASALSLLRFALPFGGTLGITIMGSVFNNKLAEGVASIQGYESGNVSAQDLAHGGTSSLSFINSLPADAQAKVRTSGRDAIMWAYVAILPIIGVSVLTTLFMGNVWIGKRKNRAASVDQGMSETEIGSRESEVISVPYLYALVKVSTQPFTYHIILHVFNNCLRGSTSTSTLPGQLWIPTLLKLPAGRKLSRFVVIEHGSHLLYTIQTKSTKAFKS